MRKYGMTLVVVGAAALGACDMNVSGNGVSVNRNDRAAENAATSVENAFEDVGQMAENTGRAIENGVDRTVGEVREGGRNTIREERREEQAEDRAEDRVENRSGR